MAGRVIVAGGAAAVLAAVLIGGWFFFIRSDNPPAVSLAGAVASLTPTPTSEGSTATPTTSNTSTGGSPEGLVGTWTLIPESDSFVGYRVREELVGIGATTAVGRTHTLTAGLEFDGATVSGVEVVADLTALQSDDNRRDGQLGRQGLQTNQFPTGSFVLAEPISLDGVPEEGVAIDVVAVGDLTLHGVTNRVSFPLQGQRVGDTVVVVGSLEIAFADYGMTAPSAASVISVEDRGVIELQLFFGRA